MRPSRFRRAFKAAVWCSLGWNCRGLLDYVADRVGDHTGRKHA